ncbi:MAG: D-threo-aldose 1-dehydrogenase [Solirubrobacteraceae bacterium]|jgi:aryl-alcohol dehydrogenase-like predicted oxidoreductase|nr:D-threo-aldose 1-dehydrogenase [Solirubrobacteraceae bacterium]
MESARFPHAGLELTRLGFGCSGLMRVTSARARQELLGAALDAGIQHFDVARMYGLGAAEGELGRFARGRRDQITIATKFGIEPAAGLGPLARFQQPARALLNRLPALRRALKRRDQSFNAPRRYDAASAKHSLETSLRELMVDYVDLFFVHDPAPTDDVRVDDLIEILTSLREAGKIRAWGVSQDAHPRLRVIDGLGPTAVLQVRDDAFSRISHDVPALTFGVLSRAHERVRHALQSDPAQRRRWHDALGADVLQGDALARLLLADALAANSEGTVLFSTTRRDRLEFAADVLRDPPAPDELGSFRALVADSTLTATPAA